MISFKQTYVFLYRIFIHIYVLSWLCFEYLRQKIRIFNTEDCRAYRTTLATSLFARDTYFSVQNYWRIYFHAIFTRAKLVERSFSRGSLPILTRFYRRVYARYLYTVELTNNRANPVTPSGRRVSFGRADSSLFFLHPPCALSVL